ncbi:MAG: GNAT family N-acetyltransferase [Planctomycetota bacterium]
MEGTELVGLYVSPSVRGQGIGRSLLAHLESFAAKQGIVRLHLTSTPSALDFYLRNGWRAGDTQVVKIMGVDFEETFLSKRLSTQTRRNKLGQ